MALVAIRDKTKIFQTSNELGASSLDDAESSEGLRREDHHSSREEFEKAIAAGCRICSGAEDLLSYGRDQRGHIADFQLQFSWYSKEDMQLSVSLCIVGAPPKTPFWITQSLMLDLVPVNPTRGKF